MPMSLPAGQAGRTGIPVRPRAPKGDPKGLPVLAAGRHRQVRRTICEYAHTNVLTHAIRLTSPCLGQARQPGACRTIAANLRALPNHHSRFSRQFARTPRPDLSAPIPAFGANVPLCPLLRCDVPGGRLSFLRFIKRIIEIPATPVNKKFLKTDNILARWVGNCTSTCFT